VLVASVALILAVVLTGCPTTPSATPTGTATPTPSGTPKPSGTPTATATPAGGVDLSYNCLNPRGIMLPVMTVSLAERLDTLDGKEGWVNQGEADPIIMPALWEMVQERFPKTSWHYIATSSFGPPSPETDVVSAADFVIRGNAW